MSGTTELLRKLLDEAPSDELDDAYVRCLKSAAALEPRARHASRTELDAVMELRSLIERYRRRSHELRALFDTASDLSSIRDEEAVLQAIVRRSRLLLNTDVAYLMLIDEDHGDTYMRVSEGTTAPTFKDIRLPMGVGLGGRVAEGLAPLWTRRYLSDSRLVHAIDDVVRDERLVAILGVPLKIGRRRLGVLFAADRDERSFTQDEVSLLASLADHAAIAIENASLFQQMRAANARLAEAQSVIESNNRRLESAIALHDHLTSVVITGGTVQDLIDVAADVLEGTLIVFDEQQRAIARAPDNCVELSAILELLDVPRSGDSSPSIRAEWRGGEALLTRIVAGASSLGSIVYLGSEIHDAHIRSLERAAAVISLLLINRRAQDEAENQVRGEVLAELLMGSLIDVDALTRRARLLNIDLDQQHVVVVVSPTSGSVPRNLQFESAAVARNAQGLISSYADRVVMLLRGSDPGMAARAVATHLHGLGVTVGASGPVSDLHVIRQHEDRARRAATLLAALGRTGEGVSTDEFGIYGLILSELGGEHVESFVDRCLGSVRQYDSMKGSVLYETLNAYFSCEANVAEAAAQLFVHVNTMYQRLSRLDEVLGEGWRTGDRALEIRLALRLDQLVRDIKSAQ